MNPFLISFIQAGFFLDCVLVYFVFTKMVKSRMSSRKIKNLLKEKGYCSQQIVNIVNFYNSGFLKFDSLKIQQF